MAAALAAALLSVSARAIDAGTIDVHGSVSVTASSSDTYNYLGDTRDQVKFNLADVVLNGTHRFDDGLRLGAQLYAYKIGGYSEVTLDWASIDYSFQPWLGLRVGRNKVALGLYNDSQDLDSVRTFASLPITFYPKSFRAVTASCDGISPYGNVSLGHSFGSIDYQAYVGAKENIAGDSPFVKQFDDLATFNTWQFQSLVYGGSLFWNPPIDGLRVGYSYLDLPRASLRGVLSSTGQMRADSLAIPTMVNAMMGAAAWNSSGLFAGTLADIREEQVQFRVLSAEYTTGPWLVAAEFKLIDMSHGYSYIPALALLRQPVAVPYALYGEETYAMVTYQATAKVGLGAYYSYENDARDTAGSGSNPAYYTDDYAVAFSYAPTANWVFKIEDHVMHGRSFIYSAGDDNGANATKNSWNYLVAKATFTF